MPVLRSATDEGKRPRGNSGESTTRPPPENGSDSHSRRHSWAGERKSPGGSGGSRLSGKPTSLQEFKRLLAQQTPGQNPHRVSAQEMLKTAAGGQEAGAASQLKSGGGGSLRKKTSPWRDNRFSVIQEEAEQDESRKSRENLFH
jgi:hypothetical protein